MHCPSGRRTWRYRIFRKKRDDRRGSMTLMTAVFVVLFSTLGLGIAHLSQIYMRLAAYKKTSIRLDYAAENGLKEAFRLFVDQLEAVPSPLRLSATEYVELRADSQNGGGRILGVLLGTEPPFEFSGGMGLQQWDSRIDLSQTGFSPFDSYFSTVHGVNIASDGRVMNFPAERRALLEADLGLQTGRIPLSLLPVAVGKDLSRSSIEEYLAEHKIHIDTSGIGPKQIPPPASGEDLLPLDAQELVQKALNIDIFRPQDLTPARLRTAIGLEPGAEPIPDGVYLIRDDLGLGGIYVRGDLSRMILAIDHDDQVIAFWQGQKNWILRYSPLSWHTSFRSPEEELFFDLIPRGIIIVDGTIESLGGGLVLPSGELVFQSDEESACILRGIDLTIVCSDRITLTSHLVHQGVTWQDGIPYAKDSESQLHILATGSTALGLDNGAGEIIIDSQSRGELKLQADITALEEGITLMGDDRTVSVFGSLHFSEYDSHDNTLRLHPDTGLLENEHLIRNAPLTRFPVLLCREFRVLIWRPRLQ